MKSQVVVSPFPNEDIKNLRTGDSILVSGSILTARDVAHKRLSAAVEKGLQLPVNIAGQTFYYTGPSPARPGQIIGSCGPTTSKRMDEFTPVLLANGLKVMIGKGQRSKEVKDAIRQYQALYLVTYGGAGALLSKCVKKAEILAYTDAGAEAVMRLEVENFPAVVAYDVWGGDLFGQEITRYSNFEL